MTLENSQSRERLRDAIAKAKELETQLMQASSDDGTKRTLEEVKNKYGEAVTRMKAQAEQNKVVNEKYRELADKYRKAVAIIDELKKRMSASMVPAVAKTIDPLQSDDDDDMPAGESTLVLENPLLKK